MLTNSKIGQRADQKAIVFQIVRKVKRRCDGPPSVTDFRVTGPRAIPIKLLIGHRNVSLYCLDSSTNFAFFVETCKKADLCRAPFFYQAQYENAQRLIAVPIYAIRFIANHYRNHLKRVIFVFNIGRCGSTLVSKIFKAVNEVVSLSEPEAFGHDYLVSTAQHTHTKITQLLRDCIYVIYGPYCPKTTLVIKWRAHFTGFGHLLHLAFPEAKTIFLYRDPLAWAKSFSRFGWSECELADFWNWHIQNYMQMKQHGMAPLMLRYDDLVDYPDLVVKRMLEHCSLPTADTPAACKALNEDSQKESKLSQKNLLSLSKEGMSSFQLDKFRQRILNNNPLTLNSDFILPGTFIPK